MVKEILDGVITGVTGAGDVDGPSSSTDNAVARYDGATGKTIQNSSVLINDAGDLTVTGDIYTNGVLVPAEGAEYTSRTVNVDSTMTTAEIQAAIDGIGKYLDDGVVITVQFADGTYTMTDTLYVKGFRGGGEIYLYGNAADASLSTSKSVILQWTNEAYGIDVVNCDNAFVERMELSRDDTSFVGTGRIVRFYNGGRGTLRNCYLKSTGKAGTQFAVNVAVMQGFVLTNVYFEKSDYGLYTTNSQVFVSGCASVVGSEPTYGIGSNQGALVGISPGGEPDGSTSKYRSALGGTIVYDGVVLGSTLHVDNDNERVGIGTDTPSYVLDVVDTNEVSGTITVQGTGGAVCSISAGNQGNFGTITNDILNLRTNNTIRASVNTDGDFYVDTDTLYVDAVNDYVGIGTSSPLGLLHLEEDDGTNSGIISDNYGGGITKRNTFNFRKANGTAASPTTVATDQDIFIINMQAHDGTSFETVATMLGEVEEYVGTNDISGRIVFSTRPTGLSAAQERLRITGDGNVGILQTDPQGKLHVGDGSGVSSFPTSNDEFIMEHSSSGGIGIFTPDANYGSVLFGSPSDTAAGVVRWSYDNNHLQIGTQTTGAETQLMSSNGAVGLTLDSDGNVGIGTTSPSELLVVGDDLGNMGSGNGLVIGDDTNKPALYIGVDGNNRSSQAWNQFNNYWSISNWVGGTAYTDVLTIKADKVGINDTTPSYELDVTGDAQVTGTLYGAARIYAHYTKTVSATQDIGGVAGTTTAISWDSEINEDTGFTHDNATNNSRVTVTNAGRYEIKATVSAKNSGAGRFGGEIYFKINGTTDVKRGISRAYSRGSAYNDDISLHLSTEYDLSASDYIEIITNVDDTDATYTVNTNDVECELIIRKLD